MKLLVIAEGSEKNGLGHLYRTRTFAEAARSCAEVSLLVLAETGLAGSIFRKFDDITTVIRHHDEILQHTDAFKPDYVVFDMLEADDGVFQKIKAKSVKTVSLSPIFSHAGQVDLIFTRGKLPAPVGPAVYSGIQFVIPGSKTDKITDSQYDRALHSRPFPISVAMGGDRCIQQNADDTSVARSVYGAFADLGHHGRRLSA
jgi:hypothetical protein